MSSNSLKILESLQEENINMRHFLLLPTPIFFSGEGKKKKERRKYIVQVYLIITLSLGSIEMDRVISETVL